MIRTLHDRIAEAMRRERLGLMRPLWADANDETKAAWTARAVHLTRLLKELGVFTAVKDD